MTDSLAIETVDLTKKYGQVEALRGLNLQVPTGSIFGFLGRNGAGKTTTAKVLLGMTRPSSGQARVLGLRADDRTASVGIRARTAFVNDEKDLFDYMTVDEMIRFTAPFFPRWRSESRRPSPASHGSSRPASCDPLGSSGWPSRVLPAAARPPCDRRPRLRHCSRSARARSSRATAPTRRRSGCSPNWRGRSPPCTSTWRTMASDSRATASAKIGDPFVVSWPATSL